MKTLKNIKKLEIFFFQKWENMTNQTVNRDVGSFHGEGDAVEGNEEEDEVVKPLLAHQPNAQLPESVVGG